MTLAAWPPRRRRLIRLMVSTRIAASRANRCLSGDTASITVQFAKKAQSISSSADILASRTRDGTMKKQQNLDHGAWEAVTSGAVEIVDRAHLKSRVERGDRLRVKLGLDPTKPDLHLGHTVPLRALRRYQQHGHQAVLIIGDWTARIGDPSGQNVTRPQLTKDDVDGAAQTYLDQAWKILDEAETEVRLQSEWFDKMRLEDVVQLTSRYTVARMLARDDFAKRTKEGRPVGMHELLYPLLQAYDSVAVKSDLELGGTDQTFNLLVGRDIQEAYGQPPQDIQTMPLLEGLDGIQKMSKSLDNYIGIAESPSVMYRKAMSVPDQLILRYLQLVTDVDSEQLAAEARALREGANPRDVKQRLAERIVRQFHPNAETTEYREESGGFKSAGPAAIDVGPAERTIAQLFLDAGLVASKNEARRLVGQKGLRVNGQPVRSADDKLIPIDDMVLQRGLHRVVRLKVR
ncbi:MAG: tyrosine--tRNA ligase [Chloroflexi bacterium]|nr:MAG: tyrosine--tRNA ligase [Chloroflexota bacterium]